MCARAFGLMGVSAAYSDQFEYGNTWRSLSKAAGYPGPAIILRVVASVYRSRRAQSGFEVTNVEVGPAILR